MKTRFKFSMNASRPSLGAVVFVGAILLLAATMNAEAQYNYTTLNVPGSSYSETYAYGFSGNNIVG